MSDLVGPDGRYLDGRPPPVLARSVRRPAGHVEVIGPPPLGHYAGSSAEQRPENAAETGDTLMCVHCQKHSIIRPGSGTKRGFCFNCDGVTCGKQACEESCVPFEKAIEQTEAQARRSLA
jgi:hypothetical protein